VFASTSGYHHCYYEPSSFTAGGAIVLGTEEPQYGGGARLYYNLKENICFGPEILRLENEHETATEINMVIHYIFDVAHFGAYPVAGIGYSNELHLDRSVNPLLGLGVHRNIKGITLFAEYDHIFSQQGNDKVAFGLLYMFHL
jgi:hypothetical protein